MVNFVILSALSLENTASSNNPISALFFELKIQKYFFSKCICLFLPQNKKMRMNSEKCLIEENVCFYLPLHLKKPSSFVLHSVKCMEKYASISTSFICILNWIWSMQKLIAYQKCEQNSIYIDSGQSLLNELITIEQQDRLIQARNAHGVSKHILNWRIAATNKQTKQPSCNDEESKPFFPCQSKV